MIGWLPELVVARYEHEFCFCVKSGYCPFAYSISHWAGVRGVSGTCVMPGHGDGTPGILKLDLHNL